MGQIDNSFLMLLLAGFALALGLVFFLISRLTESVQLRSEEILLAKEQLASEKNDLAALCHAATNTDQRLVMLEQQLAEMDERLLTLQTEDRGDRSYHMAIQQAQNGATLEQLSDDFNISHEEADLIVRLYGSDHSSLDDDSGDEVRIDL